MSKDIWHTADEIPDFNKSYVELSRSVQGDLVYSTWGHPNYITKNTIKWCYMEDLLELETELDHTRKELEQSEICCSAWEEQALDYKAELIRTKQALDITINALEFIGYDKDNELDCFEEFAISQMIDKACKTLDQIKQITESPAENVQPDIKTRPVNVQK